MSGTQPRKLGLMSWITGLMFLGGLAAGPGYWIYCAGFSGKLASEHIVVAQGGGFRPIEIDLDPSMSPVRVEISGTLRKRSGRAKPVGYHVALLDGRTVLLEKSANFELGEKDRDSVASSIVLGTATVLEAAKYAVRVRGGNVDRDTVAISDVRISVWRNAREANMKIVWWGIGVMLAGLLIGIATGDTVPVQRSSD